MPANSQAIIEALVATKQLTVDAAKHAEELAREHHATLVEQLLVDGQVPKAVLGATIARTFGIEYVDLATQQPAEEAVLKIPEDIAKKYRVVVAALSDTAVTVATDDPKQTGIEAALARNFPKHRLTLAYAFSHDITETFVFYQKPLATRFSNILAQGLRVAPGLIDEIIHDAVAFRASDVHCEPRESEVLIRFRIDGVLKEAGRIPKDAYENILNRIKVQAHLRIDEHASAQDGAIRYDKGDVQSDLRVSIIPTLDGEKIVMRILSQYVRQFSLNDLGFAATDQQMLAAAGRKPFGMIIVVGPTGSGKTTTMYALLKELHRPEVNVTTIEDPVEYKIVGVNQIQVNEQTKLTFAEGLRSIVRQDPDIILVGEIRDQETAEIAVNAALTGHLMLSTFHANDAATAVPRLLDMGVEPFLLASTLELVLAQRLVRRLCGNCRVKRTLTRAAIAKMAPTAVHFFGASNTVYQAQGCASCGGTGYKGRIAILEFIPFTQALKDLVLTNPSTQQIWSVARRSGAHTLFEDGVAKVRDGITTLDELLRVAGAPSSESIGRRG